MKLFQKTLKINSKIMKRLNHKRAILDQKDDFN